MFSSKYHKPKQNSYWASLTTAQLSRAFITLVFLIFIFMLSQTFEVKGFIWLKHSAPDRQNVLLYSFVYLLILIRSCTNCLIGKRSPKFNKADSGVKKAAPSLPLLSFLLLVLACMKNATVRRGSRQISVFLSKLSNNVKSYAAVTIPVF